MGCRNVFLAENSWASHLIRSANLHVEDKKDPEEKSKKTKRLIQVKEKVEQQKQQQGQEEQKQQRQQGQVEQQQRRQQRQEEEKKLLEDASRCPNINSLRKKSAFSNATTGLPRKMASEK